jgi:hypothetical protein
MYNKLNNLAFVIGAFFTVVSLILFVNIVIKGNADTLSISTASAFLIFGLVMMLKG